MLPRSKVFRRAKSNRILLPRIMASKPNADYPKMSCQKNFEEFAKETSLHGVKFLGNPKLSLFERAIFGIAVISVAITISYFIVNIYDKWSSSPIIIGLNARQRAVSELPFPAITICNMNAARKSIVNAFNNDPFKEFLLNSLCTNSIVDNKPEWANYSGVWSLFKNFMIDVAQPCEKMLLECRFGGKLENCSSIFEWVLTDEGLCCSFNMIESRFLYKSQNISNAEYDFTTPESLTAVDWSAEDGFITNLTDGFYPRKATGTGAGMGLSLILNADVDDYYCSSTFSYGFKVVIHTPTEAPKVSHYAKYLATGYESRISVSPNIANAMYHIRPIAKTTRQCIFNDESNLMYFRKYSKRNCERECEAQILEMTCGCIMYHMPRLSADTLICSRRDALCYDGVDFNKKRQILSLDCECPPGCFEMTFGSEITQATLRQRSASENTKLFNYTSAEMQKNIAIAHFFYSSGNFRAQTKSELIGVTDFLSSIGGVFSLLSGFSVITIIETFYFFLIRPYFERRRILIKKQETIKAWNVIGHPTDQPKLSFKNGVNKLIENMRNNRVSPHYPLPFLE